MSDGLGQLVGTAMAVVIGIILISLGLPLLGTNPGIGIAFIAGGVVAVFGAVKTLMD